MLREKDLDLEGQTWLKENAASVLDAVVDAIITIDASGYIQSYNHATEKLFGYDGEELKGQPVSMLMPDPYRSQHQRYIASYLNTHQPQIIGIGRELEAVRKDGSVFPIYLAVSDIQKEGEFFVGIIRDLSEQRATQQALLEQKDRVAHVGRLTTMGEMTASIAHEINQPLTAIAMYAQACMRLLGKDEIDKNKVLDAMRKLSEQSLRAGDVIERIQQFVQNSSASKQLADINALIGDIHHLVSGDARLHGVELRFDLAEGLPQLFVDTVQIHQVALNLVRNAIDAMFEIDLANGKTIEVRSELVGDMVRVSVVDQGPGVPKDFADKLFTPFHSTKRDGMGMGLSICNNIISDHGGQMGYANHAIGATFYFTLPVVVADGEPQSDQER